jgi:hypothetical protein
MKKFLVLSMMILICFLSSCTKRSDLGIDILDLDLDLSGQTLVSISTLKDFTTNFFDDYESLSPQCSIKDNEKNVFSREDVEKMTGRACDFSKPTYQLSKDYVLLLLDVILTDYENITTNDKILIKSKYFIIKYDEKSLVLMNYREDGTSFSEYIMTSIDDELYLEMNHKSEFFDKDYAYTHIVYYENHYVLYDYLDISNYFVYRENLETKEFYYIQRYFINQYVSTPNAVRLSQGNDDYHYTILYQDNDLYGLTSTILNEGVFAMSYTDYFVDRDDVTYISVLELDNWDQLRRKTNYPIMLEIYLGDEHVYIDYEVGLTSYMTNSLKVSLLVNKITNNEVIIGDSHIDISQLLKAKDKLEKNYKQIMRDFNVSPNESTYEDYLNDFSYFDDLISEYMDTNTH